MTISVGTWGLDERLPSSLVWLRAPRDPPDWGEGGFATSYALPISQIYLPFLLS